MSRRRFVLLDRDGTIVEKHDYLSDPNQLKLLPGAAEGLRILRQMQFGMVLVTNQSGVRRGLFDMATLAEIHDRLVFLLAQNGIDLDGIYVCPHRPDDKCSCRKPAPGLVEQASSELGFDPHDCFVIGDNACDVELGHSVGATTVLVRSGCGRDVENAGLVTPHHIVDDLLAAATLIRRAHDAT